MENEMRKNIDNFKNFIKERKSYLDRIGKVYIYPTKLGLSLRESIIREYLNESIDRTVYKEYKVGDVINGNKLDDLSGGLVGSDSNKYMLVNQDLSIYPYTRQDLIDLDIDYADEEIWRLESIKDNFEKTPPIPEEGDGMHRIIAAKELGYKTILMWKKI